MSWFLNYLLLCAVASVIMVLTGRIAGLYVFVRCNFFVSWLYNFLYLCSMGSLALFLASLVTERIWANLLYFLVFVIVVFLSLFVASGRQYENLYSSEGKIYYKLLAFPWPFIHYSKVWIDVIAVTSWRGNQGFSGADFTLADLGKPVFVAAPYNDPAPGSPMASSPGVALGWMVLLTLVYNILGWYCTQAFAGEGSKSLFFPFTPSYWGFVKESQVVVQGDALAAAREESLSKKSIKLVNLSKSYASKTALKEVTFDIDNSTCLALLGHNGAVRTTTLCVADDTSWWLVFTRSNGRCPPPTHTRRASPRLSTAYRAHSHQPTEMPLSLARVSSTSSTK